MLPYPFFIADADFVKRPADVRFRAKLALLIFIFRDAASAAADKAAQKAQPMIENIQETDTIAFDIVEIALS